MWGERETNGGDLEEWEEEEVVEVGVDEVEEEVISEMCEQRDIWIMSNMTGAILTVTPFPMMQAAWMHLSAMSDEGWRGASQRAEGY